MSFVLGGDAYTTSPLLGFVLGFLFQRGLLLGECQSETGPQGRNDGEIQPSLPQAYMLGVGGLGPGLGWVSDTSLWIPGVEGDPDTKSPWKSL